MRLQIEVLLLCAWLSVGGQHNPAAGLSDEVLTVDSDDADDDGHA